MGKATITSEIGGGLYNVRLEYNRTRVDAELASLNVKLTDLEALIVELQLDQTEKQGNANSADNDLQFAIDNGTDAEIKTATKALLAASSELSIATQSLKSTQLQKGSVEKRISEIEGQDTGRDVQAWCADYTEGATGEVGTLEVGRQQETLPIILPEAPIYNANTHGQLMQIMASTPSATYLNYAQITGVNKWFPRYRIATIDALNGDLCDVTLDATETASLDINQTTTLSDVPILYMTSDGETFLVGDRVVVQFIGQDWAQPRVIGYETNPRQDRAKFILKICVERWVANGGGNENRLCMFWDVSADELYPIFDKNTQVELDQPILESDILLLVDDPNVTAAVIPVVESTSNGSANDALTDTHGDLVDVYSDNSFQGVNMVSIFPGRMDTGDLGADTQLLSSSQTDLEVGKFAVFDRTVGVQDVYKFEQARSTLLRWDSTGNGLGNIGNGTPQTCADTCPIVSLRVDPDTGFESSLLGQWSFSDKKEYSIDEVQFQFDVPNDYMYGLREQTRGRTTSLSLDGGKSEVVLPNLPSEKKYVYAEINQSESSSGNITGTSTAVPAYSEFTSFIYPDPSFWSEVTTAILSASVDIGVNDPLGTLKPAFSDSIATTTDNFTPSLSGVSATNSAGIGTSKGRAVFASTVHIATKAEALGFGDITQKPHGTIYVQSGRAGTGEDETLYDYQWGAFTAIDFDAIISKLENTVVGVNDDVFGNIEYSVSEPNLTFNDAKKYKLSIYFT